MWLVLDLRCFADYKRLATFADQEKPAVMKIGQDVVTAGT
jgi:hypothetical protein